MVLQGVCRPPQKGYPYQLPHTSVLASDHEPNRRIPYTRSVASDCGGREVTGVPCQSQASYLPHLSAHTHALANLQKREIGLRLLPSVQMLLRLTPAGCGQRTTRVTTRTVLGTGFDFLPGLGFFPHGMGFFRMAWASPSAWLGSFSNKQPT